MKKLLSLALVFVLILSISTTVFAADIEANNGTATGEVKASYVAGEPGGTVVSVDIEWKNLEFTYNGESHKVWNPESHSYEGVETPAGWATSNASITITNHSNTYIYATLSYTKETNYSDASVVFGSSNVWVGNADNGSGAAQSTTIPVVPTGYVPETIGNETKIGEITVKIRTAEAYYSGEVDTLNAIITDLNMKRTSLQNSKAADPSTLDYGTVYCTETGITNAVNKISAAAALDMDSSATEYEKINAINAAILALNSAYLIKH